MKLLIIGIPVIISFLAIWSFFGGGWKVVHRKAIGYLTLSYGLYLASLTGTVTSFVLPGIGSIALGTATGAAVGFGTWLAIGTVGLVTGGVGIAVGVGMMVGYGALIGGFSGAAGSIGLRQTVYPLVAWYFWVPVVLLGTYLVIGQRKRKLQMLSPPATDNGENVIT